MLVQASSVLFCMLLPLSSLFSPPQGVVAGAIGKHSVHSGVTSQSDIQGFLSTTQSQNDSTSWDTTLELNNSRNSLPVTCRHTAYRTPTYWDCCQSTADLLSVSVMLSVSCRHCCYLQLPGYQHTEAVASQVQINCRCFARPYLSISCRRCSCTNHNNHDFVLHLSKQALAQLWEHLKRQRSLHLCVTHGLISHCNGGAVYWKG